MNRPVEPSLDLAQDVLESLVTLTEQRDQRSLEHSLITALKEMIDHDTCWLLNIPSSNEPLAIRGNEKELPPPVIDAAITLNEEQGPVLVNIDGQNYLMVKILEADGACSHILVLGQKTQQEADLRLVQGMLKVYLNYIALLYDSEKDTLTGLFNRRKLERQLDNLLAARLHGRRLQDHHLDFLAILDLDRFKRINDTYGHLIGDEVLLNFANILRKTLRDTDQIFRYGGEEFIILLQDISDHDAGMVLERVRRNVAEFDFPQVGQVTVSIGYSVVSGHLMPTQIIEEADRALYYAKEHGRDQVRDYRALIALGAVESPQKSGSIELF